MDQMEKETFDGLAARERERERETATAVHTFMYTGRDISAFVRGLPFAL